MRLSYPPAASYYAASSAPTATGGADGAILPRETLRGEHRADVVVLGGGIAGCSAALHLAKRGYGVALLEARSVGYGASGRSGCTCTARRSAVTGAARCSFRNLVSNNCVVIKMGRV